MNDKVTLIKPETDPDPVATMYRAVRDATKCNTSGPSLAEKIAVLDVVKHELLVDFQKDVFGG